MANDRGPQSHGMWVIHLAEEFAETIQILGITRIGLAISTFVARKNAIGADMNQTRLCRSANQGDPVRELGVDGDGGQRITADGKLLYQARRRRQNGQL